MGHTNHSLNHIALSVPSIEAAAQWYIRVFGFTRLREDVVFSRKEDPDAVIFHIYPSNLNTVKVAFLQTGDGLGFELFEFIDPPYRQAEKATEFNAESFTRGGFFHIALTVRLVDILAAKAISNGATQIGNTMQVGLAQATYLMDPWGNVIELLSRRFDEVVQDGIGRHDRSKL